MIEYDIVKKNKSELVVWFTICFLIVSLTAIFFTSIFSPQIVANAEDELAPYHITEPVGSYEHYPTFDFSAYNNPHVFQNTENSPLIFNPLEATGFAVNYFLDLSPERNKLENYTVVGVKKEPGTVPSHFLQMGGYIPVSRPYLQIMTACSHAEYYPTLYVHYYGNNRTFIGSQAFVPYQKWYTPNKWIVQEYDLTTYTPVGAVEWAYDIHFDFDEGDLDTRYYLAPVLNFTSATKGFRTTEHILDCLEYWYGIQDEHWRLRYVNQVQINDMMRDGATLEGALTSITSTPINLLKDLMSFEIEILGIDVKQLLIFIFSLAVVGVVIKIIIGRS